jgi:hypothetical protein
VSQTQIGAVWFGPIRRAKDRFDPTEGNLAFGGHTGGMRRKDECRV